MLSLLIKTFFIKTFTYSIIYGRKVTCFVIALTLLPIATTPAAAVITITTSASI